LFLVEHVNDIRFSDPTALDKEIIQEYYDYVLLISSAGTVAQMDDELPAWLERVGPFDNAYIRILRVRGD
jgi:hypothetical protein